MMLVIINAAKGPPMFAKTREWGPHQDSMHAAGERASQALATEEQVSGAGPGAGGGARLVSLSVQCVAVASCLCRHL